MGLENTFGEVKKLPKEKQLEVITSTDAVVDDLRAYYEKNKYKGFRNIGECREYFSSCMDFLHSFELKPEMITEFNKKIGSMEEGEAFGIYLTAMIQTNYNQGFNNFTFEEINANFFGAELKGEYKNPINIIVKELKGYDSLWCAENCSLTTENIEGDDSLWHAKNCTLITKTLKGHFSLCAENCFAEIQKYQGRGFGFGMMNCTIKSGNEKTIERIKEQATYEENNRFELIK